MYTEERILALEQAVTELGHQVRELALLYYDAVQTIARLKKARRDDQVRRVEVIVVYSEAHADYAKALPLPHRRRWGRAAIAGNIMTQKGVE